MTKRLNQMEYPFAAIVGQRAAKRALMLLSIDPELKGALIASDNQWDKGNVARAFCSLLADNDWTVDRGGDARATVEVPIGVTEDRLLGGLDLERTMLTGKREIADGLLSQANQGVLLVSNINLLELTTVANIAHALDSRSVRIEREGMSKVQPASFIMVGTVDLTGDHCSLLFDRVGLIVESPAECSPDERAETIYRALRFNEDAVRFAEDFALETAETMSLINEARDRLRQVRVSRNQIGQMALVGMKLGVEGNRADLFALRAARANAALAGRDEVNDDDLVVAISLVLVPRSTTLPEAADEASKQDPAPPETDSDDRECPTGRKSEWESDGISTEDLLIRAMDSRTPDGLLSFTPRKARVSGAGKRFKNSTAKRGRYIRSSTKRTGEARVAFDATLRASAPFQLDRRVRSSASKPGFARPGDLKETSIQTGANARLTITKSDLRFKHVRHRSGSLFVFVVDASGSMAVNRLAQAKGALIRLLGQAYLNRDKVALISFRGEGSEVLLAPTRSVELAKRLAHTLPAGGGTPVSTGVTTAIELARRARLRGTPHAMLVLFTDGRANVSLCGGRNSANIEDELRQLGRLLHSEGISAVLVDTKSKFISHGEGYALAKMLGARYFYLPRADAKEVCEIVTRLAGRRAINPVQ